MQEDELRAKALLAKQKLKAYKSSHGKAPAVNQPNDIKDAIRSFVAAQSRDVDPPKSIIHPSHLKPIPTPVVIVPPKATRVESEAAVDNISTVLKDLQMSRPSDQDILLQMSLDSKEEDLTCSVEEVFVNDDGVISVAADATKSAEKKREKRVQAERRRIIIDLDADAYTPEELAAKNLKLETTFDQKQQVVSNSPSNIRSVTRIETTNAELLEETTLEEYVAQDGDGSVAQSDVDEKAVPEENDAVTHAQGVLLDAPLGYSVNDNWKQDDDDDDDEEDDVPTQVIELDEYAAASSSMAFLSEGFQFPVDKLKVDNFVE